VDDDMAALLEKRKASRLAAWEKARDKMEAAAVVAEADEKNDELAAKAKDAARIFAELDEAKGAREKREADDEESSFTSLGLHAVRNTRESWIPGVLTGFTTLGFSEYKDDQAWLAVEVDPADGPFFVVPSTWEPGEEGLFTLSLSASCELDVSEVEDSDGLNKVKLKGSWSSSNQGPRGKTNGGNEEKKNFKPEKTWNKNPQFRVWLADPETDEKHESVGIQIELTTPLEGAEMGLHVMRNAFCQFYNEKIEVLADRYQKVVGKTPRHETSNEVSFDITLDDNFEVKKNGCENGFPFFIVPSLMDKKMSGNFTMIVYSDKPVTIQMLDDAARKL